METETQMRRRSVGQDFPILAQTVHGKRLVYLDSSASTQKPNAVIEAISQYYRHDNANVHRGVYELSQRATEFFEQARKTVQQFINSQHAHEIIFTKGTTEAINLVANTYGREQIRPGDEIILTRMEHHSNIVPWQLLAQQVGAVIRVVDLLPDGRLDLEHYARLFSDKTKLVSLIHVSNVLGTINPIKEMIAQAHEKNVPVLVDAAQSVAHMPVDVQALDCDFLAFSGHKLYGPTGIGVLYGKERHLEKMPPYQGGGDMIRQVSFEKTEYNELPYKFEAGTPNMAGAIGLAAAIHYVQGIGMDAIQKHEIELLHYATQEFSALTDIKIIGNAPEKAGVISFVMEDVHPHDIGTILDHEGVAIRVGHHCAMPLMDYLQLPATARASFGIHNSFEDIDALIAALTAVRKIFT